jgi:hypothetical protein
VFNTNNPIDIHPDGIKDYDNFLLPTGKAYEEHKKKLDILKDYPSEAQKFEYEPVKFDGDENDIHTFKFDYEPVENPFSKHFKNYDNPSSINEAYYENGMEQFEGKDGKFSATEFRNKEVIDRIQTRNSFLDMLEYEKTPIGAIEPFSADKKAAITKNIKPKDKKFIEKHDIKTKEEFNEKKRTIRKTQAPFIRPVPAGHTMPMGIPVTPVTSATPRKSTARNSTASTSTARTPAPARARPTTAATPPHSTTTPLSTPIPTTSPKPHTNTTRPASAGAKSSSKTNPIFMPTTTTPSKRQTQSSSPASAVATTPAIIQPAFKPPHSKEGPKEVVVPPIPSQNKKKPKLIMTTDANMVTPQTNLTGSDISAINKDMDKTKSVNTIIRLAENAREDLNQGTLTEIEYREMIEELQTHFRKFKPRAEFPDALK